jgi:hypothetical protein
MSIDYVLWFGGWAAMIQAMWIIRFSVAFVADFIRGSIG